MDQRDVNEREWHAPGNWRWGWLGVYSSEQDSRLVVPKRNRIMGWTLNFAHRSSWLWLAVVLGVPLLMVLVAARA